MRGGHRPGAGRRPKRDVPGVAHRRRQDISGAHPILVTLRVREEHGSLRRRRVHDVVRDCLREVCDRGWFRVCHYSVQEHHILLIVEANSRFALGRGLQGINVRIAKSLNRLWQHKGSVFVDRYQAQVLDQPRDVRRALALVLLGFRQGRGRRASRLDPYSSAEYFDGWLDVVPAPPPGAAPVARPRSARLRRTWRSAGLISSHEVPPESVDD